MLYHSTQNGTLVKPTLLKHMHGCIMLYDMVINYLTPEGDQRLISPYYITPESHISVTRIKKMITSQGSPWLFNKLSLSAP